MIDQKPDAERRLAELAGQVRREMEMLSFATKPWVMPVKEDGAVLPDVTIIGGGQSGLAVGLELKRRGVANFVILDANPAGFEGVWETYARNYEIRSPKDITGMEGGLPSLAIESYVIARYGQEGWDGIKRIPRTVWMAYLRWFRAVTDLPIRNDTRVIDLDFDAGGVTLTLGDGSRMRTRQVVLATGMEGGGGWRTPREIAETLPPEVYNHSADIFDEAYLGGKRVGVLGAGAAAFDMAVTALEAGAARVDMFLRRRDLPMRDVIRELENGGYLVHANRIPDQTKWNISKYMNGLSQAPAEHHFHKACSYENFTIHLGSPWQTIRWTGQDVHVRTPLDDWTFDHVFTATGVSVDMARRPELARIHANAALWRDRFVPDDGDLASPRLDFPYLDGQYRFTERVPGTAPGLDRIFAFNALAGLSMGGLAAVSIGAFRFGTRKLVDAVTERLFDEQVAAIVPYLDTFDKPGVTVPENMANKLEACRLRLAALELENA
ncbi:Predicted flavoprotein CzcO associated with the cation diffusion facilitator CzcD [Faunimonas pinastri]|uniref:Predicted flavoprotein CzcO associated with the cation diffusion facilitator CzcD n=1 Tax=Faunimonas pinastri TaxID=1855383 RepID=A0A1H9EQC0_9HYPH|nr:NAD(P)/FAD-dependent oxidoreductase [Faunimonas pinastri]SEQ27802.1 Predicted flavoprotein CzcO associated with the cation diffusion facilitator CzcD [Faunimonas pinastri]